MPGTDGDGSPGHVQLRRISQQAEEQAGEQTSQPLPTATWEATLLAQLSPLSLRGRGPRRGLGRAATASSQASGGPAPCPSGSAEGGPARPVTGPPPAAAPGRPLSRPGAPSRPRRPVPAPIWPLPTCPLLRPPRLVLPLFPHLLHPRHPRESSHRVWDLLLLSWPVSRPRDRVLFPAGRGSVSASLSPRKAQGAW